MSAPLVRLECGECGKKDFPDAFCDPTSSEPYCKECAAGFEEMMGDDPHGKGWAS